MTPSPSATELPPLPLPPIAGRRWRCSPAPSGDHNPIHIDLDVARAAGLDDVFAHGMLSHGLPRAGCSPDGLPQQRIRSFRVRFAAITPVHARPTCTGRVVAVDGDDGDARTVRARSPTAPPPSPATPSSPPAERDTHGNARAARSPSSPAPAAASGGRSRSSSRREGAAVVVNDLDAEPAKETVADIERAGGRAVACPGSVTEPDFAERSCGRPSTPSAASTSS